MSLQVDQAAELIAFAVSASILLIVWIFLRPWILLNIFRDDLHGIRRELFEAIRDARLPFSDPSYIAARDLLNGTIRYAHEITPFLVTLNYLRWRKRGGGVIGVRTGIPLLTEDAEVAERVKAAVAKFEARLGRHLIWGSITGLLLAASILARAAYRSWRISERRNLRMALQDNQPLHVAEMRAIQTARADRGVSAPYPFEPVLAEL